jgi:hypothetical protein
MDKKTFINKCLQSGYCSRKAAEKYCKSKNNLTENDFIEVYRIAEHAREMTFCNDKYHKVEGAKTTKIYIHRGC